ALARILGAVAARRPLLVVLDDLHWADVDSRALLDDLLERAPSRVMILATSRFDVEANAATAWVRARAAGRELPVTPLDDDVIARIITSSAATAPPVAGSAALDALVTASAGLPALAEVAGRTLAHGAGAGPLSASLERLVEAQGPLERDVLGL